MNKWGDILPVAFDFIQSSGSFRVDIVKVSEQLNIVLATVSDLLWTVATYENLAKLFLNLFVVLVELRAYIRDLAEDTRQIQPAE